MSCWDLGAWEGLEWKSTEPQSEGRRYFQGPPDKVVLAETLGEASGEAPPPGTGGAWAGHGDVPQSMAGMGEWRGRLLSLGLNSLQKMAACWQGPKSSARKVDPTFMRLAR